MTHTEYTKNVLNIKDENIFFDENCLEICKINNIDTKVFHGYLSYNPKYYDVCGCINERSNDIIKRDWKRNCKIRLPKVTSYNTILILDKQRFYCKHCHHTFIARTNVVGFHKQISNDTELSIKLELMNKIA